MSKNSKKKKFVLQLASSESRQIDNSTDAQIHLAFPHSSRYRASSRELRVRRQQVFVLRSKGYTALEILSKLNEQYPNITINKIYDDMEFTNKNRKAYEILLICPDFAEDCKNAAKNYEDVQHQINQMIRQTDVAYSHAREMGEARAMVAGLRRIAELAVAKANMSFLEPDKTLKKLMQKSSRSAYNKRLKVNLDSLRKVLE